MGNRRKKQKSPDFLVLLRALGGPGTFFTGLQLMPNYPLLGIIVAYGGFGVALAEIIWEPWLIRKPYQLQVVLLSIIFVLIAVFTITVFPHWKLKSTAVVVELYGSTQSVANIPWNSKFTELRIAFINDSENDYQKVNILIKPDTWIYQAAMLDSPHGCELKQEPGGPNLFSAYVEHGGKEEITGTNVFGQLEMHDSLGNTYMQFASRSGHRLICDKLVSHSMAQMVFAAVAILPSAFTQMQTPKLGPGQWGFTVGEFAPDHPGQKLSWEDFLGDAPQPLEVGISGRYNDEIRAHSINESVKVSK